MPQFFFFGLQVFLIVGVGLYPDGDALYDLYVGEAFDLFGVVCEEFELCDAKMVQDELDDLIGAFIGGETQLVVRFDRVVAFVLQGVGVDLVEQTDVPALLAVVDEHPALFGNELQGKMQLFAAVAFDRAQGIPRQALRVHTHDGCIAEVIGKKREVLLAQCILESLYFESAVSGR